MVYYIDKETEADFETARNNPLGIENYFYKYVPYKEMLKENSRNQLFIIRPELWNDPWESLVLTGNYKTEKNKMRQHPLSGKVLATCFTSNYGSESQWYVYEQTESKIMLSFNKTRLIDALKDSKLDFYIGKVKYEIPQPQINKAIRTWAKENIDFFDDNIEVANYSIEAKKKLLEPLLIKRKPFEYEHEYRFFLIDPNGKNKENVIIDKLSAAIGKVTLSPKSVETLKVEKKEELWDKFKEKKLLELYQEEQKEELRKFGFLEFNASSLYMRKNETLFDLTKKS